MSEHETPTNPTNPGPSASRGRFRGRGHGRRLVVGALGLSVLAIVTAVSFRATGQGPRHSFGHGPFGHGSFTAGDAEKHVTRMVGWLVDDLKGTPEQEARLTGIATAALQDLAPLRTELHENHLRTVILLTQETVDRDALEAMRARQMTLATTASTRLTKAIADAADVLTPAQRVELAERLKKRHG